MSVPTPTLLVALADAARSEALRAVLERGGIHAAVSDPRLAKAVLDKDPVSAMLVDWDGADGTALARTVIVDFADIPVIAVTRDDTSAVVEAIRAGVSDVLPQVAAAESVVETARRVLAAAEEAPAPPSTSEIAGIIGQSQPMQRVNDLIRRAASGPATVLIRGESGTGKELVARALHAQSPRASGPFVKVHCAALPETLLESELFGYEKGAFTGATARKPGRVEAAEKGTLFLDEIGDISLATQVKLLRLLQDREYERLGGTETRRADVRFITATHRNLEKMIKAGEFREDLFYRLNVVPLWLPPLRMRHGDVEVLANHFCKALGATNGRPGARFTAEALKGLVAQRWPGNVRQLQNFIERLIVLSDSEVITDADVERELSLGDPFPTLITSKATAPPAERAPGGTVDTGSPLLPLTEEVARAERNALTRALRRAKGNRALAARLLGVGRATLYKKMQQYGVS